MVKSGEELFLTSRGKTIARLTPGTGALSFLTLALDSRNARPLAVTPGIAVLSSDDARFAHHDPADRMIAATAIHYDAPLVTCDEIMVNIRHLRTV